MAAFFRATLPALALVARSALGSFSPIIGVFSLPIRETPGEPSFCDQVRQPEQSSGECESMPASYVKFVEAAGGRVVPVSSRASRAEIEMLARSVNGFLFTGGPDLIIPPAMSWVLDISRAMHAAGDNLPVWATCLGFEFLMDYVAPGALQPGFQAMNLSNPLQLTPAALSSRMLGNASPSLVEALTLHNTTFNMHHLGVRTQRWAAFPTLVETFDVLSLSVDQLGQEYVSTIEGKGGLPWYGVMWHPEKNTFEQGLNEDGTPEEAIPHSPEAVAVEQHVANFFVSEARRNTHRFADPAELLSRLIYGYSSSDAWRPSYVEVYFLRYPRYRTGASRVYV